MNVSRGTTPALLLALLAYLASCTYPQAEPERPLPTYLVLANSTPQHLAVAAIVDDRAWPLGLLPAGDSAMVPLPTELLSPGDSLHIGLIPLGTGRPERMPPHWIRRGERNRIEFAPVRARPSIWRGT